MKDNNKKWVFLDHNSTTAVSSAIRASLVDFLDLGWGNPSSIHWAGRKSRQLLREARNYLAQGLCANPLELIFTSGATESNSSLIRSFENLIYKKHPSLVGRNEFITTEVEHPSVLLAFQWLESRGYTVHYLKVSREGQIDLEGFKNKLSSRVALVSVMLANNETGFIFPIQKMVKMTQAVGAFFHSDMVQAYGKIHINLEAFGVNYASFSSHKFYGLKGTGLLYVKKNSPFDSCLWGSQERRRRGGTENILGIHAMGLGATFLKEIPERAQQVSTLRNHLEERLFSEIEGVERTSSIPKGIKSVVTSTSSSLYSALPSALASTQVSSLPPHILKRLPNTSSLLIQGVDGEMLLMNLDLLGIAVSTGAACSSGSTEPSPTLLAIGLSPEEAQCSLRVSLGWETSLEEVDYFVNCLKIVVERLRSLNHYHSGTRLLNDK